MTDVDNLFYELIRVAIGSSDSLSRQPSSKEWKVLYDMAKKQSLVGVCFAALQRLDADANEGSARIGISEIQYLTWMGMAAKIQQRNEVLSRQCAELQARLSDCGLRSVVLKGQGVASLYSQPLRALRQPGDIDLWVDAPKEKVVALVDKKGITEKPGYLHVGTKFKDIDIELHYRPSYMRNPWHNKRFQERCETYKDKWLVRDGLMVPSLEFDLVYQLSHIYRHLFGSGIGLRQLMDYYWTLSNSPLKGDSIVPMLKSLGLFNIAGAVMYLLQVVFDMDEQYMICKADEKRGKELLRHVMQTGSFGKMDVVQREARLSLFGTMMYKASQWWVLLRHYPAETLFAPYWVVSLKLRD